MSENEVKSQVMNWLFLFRALPIRINSAAFAGEHKGKKRFFRSSSERGTSDILCCMPDGMFAAIELKKPGEEPTQEQLLFLDRVRRCGGHGIWCDSLKMLIEKLRDLGYDTDVLKCG